jgi:hypothetical protein
VTKQERIDALTRFLSAAKPDWCLTSDVVLTSLLILHSGQEYPGHAAIGEQMGVRNVGAILRSLSRLTAAGWVTRTHPTHGQPAEYHVNFGKLPGGRS